VPEPENFRFLVFISRGPYPTAVIEAGTQCLSLALSREGYKWSDIKLARNLRRAPLTYPGFVEIFSSSIPASVVTRLWRFPFRKRKFCPLAAKSWSPDVPPRDDLEPGKRPAFRAQAHAAGGGKLIEDFHFEEAPGNPATFVNAAGRPAAHPLRSAHRRKDFWKKVFDPELP